MRLQISTDALPGADVGAQPVPTRRGGVAGDCGGDPCDHWRGGRRGGSAVAHGQGRRRARGRSERRHVIQPC